MVGFHCKMLWAVGCRWDCSASVGQYTVHQCGEFLSSKFLCCLLSADSDGVQMTNEWKPLVRSLLPGVISLSAVSIPGGGVRMTGDSGQSHHQSWECSQWKLGCALDCLPSQRHSHSPLCNVWAKSPWRCRSGRGQSGLTRLICRPEDRGQSHCCSQASLATSHRTTLDSWTTIWPSSLLHCIYALALYWGKSWGMTAGISVYHLLHISCPDWLV